ncbi:MAG: hypothetical protein HY255_07090 [Betaproteobacteria bacterium]|nr:hypothetical protein [Betaproteobacteria bacterium]
MAWRHWWMMGGTGTAAMLLWVALELAGWASFRPAAAEATPLPNWQSTPSWRGNAISPGLVRLPKSSPALNPVFPSRA